MAGFLHLQSIARARAEAFLKQKEARSSGYEERGNVVIFDALAADYVPPEDKSLDRLQIESITLIIAGTDTTTRALAVGAFHLSNNRSLMLEKEKKNYGKNLWK